VVDAHRHLHVLPERRAGEAAERDERIAPEHAERPADDQHPVDLGPRDPSSEEATKVLEDLRRPDAMPRDPRRDHASGDDRRSVRHADVAADGHAVIGVDLERANRALDRVRLEQAVRVDDDDELAARDRDAGVDRIGASAVVLADDAKPRLAPRLASGRGTVDRTQPTG
jgi:hypothetical protein